LQPSALAKRVWLLLFLGLTSFYLYGFGGLALVGPDEPRYAQVAREMFQRGDLITPTLGGHTWFEKPVLLYWMMMASFRVFGISEWSARLGSPICGLLTIGAVYWLSRRLELRQALRLTVEHEPRGFAFFSTLALATSGGLIGFSRSGTFDIVVTMTITFALSFYLVAEVQDKGRHWLLAGFYSFVGVSVLAKGLIGIVIPFGIIACFYVLRRRLPDRKLILSLVWGMPLAVLVAASWYGPVIARHGWPFVNEFFIQHHFARYFSNKYQHPQPVYYYLPVMLLLALPWTPFLLESLWAARRWQYRADDATNKARVFALAWVVVPIVFFSFSGSKLPAYILPSLAGAALLVGDRLSRFVSTESPAGKSLLRPTMRFTGVLLLLAAVAGIVYVQQTGEVSRSGAVLILVPLIVVGILALSGSSKRLLTVMLVAFLPICLTIVLVNCAADGVGHRESVRDLIQLADLRGYAAAPIFMLSRIERTAEFYASGRVAYGPEGEPIKFDNGSEVARQAQASRTPILVLVPLGSLSLLDGIQGVRATVIGDNGRVAIVAIDLSVPPAIAGGQRSVSTTCDSGWVNPLPSFDCHLPIATDVARITQLEIGNARTPLRRMVLTESAIYRVGPDCN
jgi:4-amino-4-deoxy-L-arabinose transferase-like glycosyltransferase